MKRKNATRNALFSSIIALLLCVSMLVGTTFAWFTDKVESGVNTIAAGNLDIELYHDDKGTTGFTKVGNTTVLFDDVTPDLWEPGALAYENFMIKNEGTLALKYNMNLNVKEESVVNGNKLSDVIMVGINADGAFEATTREGMISEADSWTKLSEFSLDGHGDLLTAGEEKVFGLVLYWQPNANEIDNLYNVKDEALNLKIGVELLATQQMKEEDSFGKDYDEDAWMDGFKVYDAQGLQAAIDAGETKIQLEDDIDLTESLVIPAAASTFSLRAATNAVVINLNGNTINVGYQEGSTTNHIYAFENYGNVVITGNGTINARGIFNYGNMVLESGTINAIDGNGGYAVRNYEGATFTMNGGTIATTLEDDHLVDAGGYDASTIRVDEGATFVMNGGVVNNICDWTPGIYNEGITTINAGTVTSVHSTLGNEGGTTIINDGDFTCNGVEGKTQHVLYTSSGSATTINGGTFNGKDNYNGFNVDAGAGAVVNIYGGNFLPVHSGSLYGEGTISVYGGTFFDDPNARVADGYKAVANTDGTYSVIFPQESFDSLIENAQPGETVEVPSGNFTLSNANDLVVVGSGEDTVLTFTGTIESGSISNATISGEPRLAVKTGQSAVFNNVNFEGTKAWGSVHGEADFVGCTFNGLLHIDSSAATTTIKFEDCTFSETSIIKLGGSAKYVLENCTVEKLAPNVEGAWGKEWLITYCDTTFNNCELGRVIRAGKTITIALNDCVDAAGAAVTAEIVHKNASPLVYINGDDVVNTIKIGTLEELKAFANDVNVNGNGYSGKTVVLTANIDLNNEEWTPIGQTGGNGAATYFRGRFDGKGYTISNLKITNNAYDEGGNYAAGFFGFVDAGDANIVNLTIDGANVNGHHWTGVIAGYLTGNISNCTVKNATVTCTHANGDACGDKCGVIVGYVNKGLVAHNTAENCTVTAGRDAGQIVGCAKAEYVSDNTATNVTVSATGGCTGANIRNEHIGRVN